LGESVEPGAARGDAGEGAHVRLRHDAALREDEPERLGGVDGGADDPLSIADVIAARCGGHHRAV